MDPEEPKQEEVKEQEAQEEPTPGSQLADVLKNFPGAPSQEQIDAWKAQFGDVFVSGFSETEIFIWRTLRRPEFIQVQTRLNDPNDPLDNYKLEECICETCVLWRSSDVPWADGKAGTPQALSEQVMQNSNFMSPQAASVLVAKL